MIGLEVPAWIEQYGLFGFLALSVVVLILRGYLQPRSTVQEIRKDRETRVREISEIAATWRDAYQTERDARRTQTEAVVRNLEVSELTLDIVKSWDKALTALNEDEGTE